MRYICISFMVTTCWLTTGVLGQPALDSSAPPVPVQESTVAPDDEAATTKAEGRRTPEIIEVTVARTRIAKSAGSAHVLKPAQLERFEYDDPHAALLQVPGVYVRQEDGFGLRPNVSLRGASSDRSKKVTLMEDGILFGPAPYSAPAAYYFPLTTRMEQVRVIKGPSSVAYGPQTIGGAIDMVTRRIPARTQGSLDLGVGSYGYTKAHGFFGTSDAQTGFLLEGVRLHSDGFKDLPDAADTGFTRNEWMVKASHVVDLDASVLHEFRVKLGYSDEVSNETYLGLTDADFEADPDRRYPASQLDQMRNHRSQLVLQHQMRLPALGLELTSSAYRHDYERTWRKVNGLRGATLSDVLADATAPSLAEYYAVVTSQADSIGGLDTLLVGPNARTYVSQGVQTLLEGELSMGPLGQRYELGLRLHNDSVRRRHSQSGYLMVQGELVPDGNAEEYTAANEVETVAFAAHVLDAFTLGDFTLTPGLRVEWVHAKYTEQLHEDVSDVKATTTVVLPGVGAFYSLTSGLGLLAGVYRGFSPPALSAEQDDPKPEHSTNYEAGARYAQRRTRVEFIGFFNDYSNLTNICTFSNGCLDTALDSQTDIGGVHVYGLEAYAEHSLRLGPLRVPASIAYTYTRSSFQSDFVSSDPIFGDVSKGDELPYTPRHQLNGTLAFEHRYGAIAASGTYVSRAREQAGGGALRDTITTDPLFYLDVTGRFTPAKAFEFYVNARNVLDKRVIVSRRPYGARPNAPRMLQFGIKARL